MAIMVEVLDRNSQRKSLHRLDTNHVTVGRGYEADVQLDDPYIDATHISIDQRDDDTLVINDNDSLNGTLVNGEHSAQASVTERDIITLGRSRMRVFSSQRHVAPAQKLNPMEARIEWMNSVWVAALLALIYAGLNLYSDYLTQFSDVRWGSLLGQTGAQLLVLCVWPLFFGLLAKLNSKEARLTSQFSLLWMTLIITFAISTLEIVLRFNTGQQPWIDTLMLGVVAIICWSFYWLTLFIAFHQPQRRRHMITSVMTFLTLLPLSYFTFHYSDNFSQRASYDSTLLPPAFLLRSPQPVNQLMQDADALFNSVDSLRDAGSDK